MSILRVITGLFLLGSSSLVLATPCTINGGVDGGADCGEFVDIYEGNDQGNPKDPDFLKFLDDLGFDLDDVVEFDSEGGNWMGEWDAGMSIAYLVVKASNSFLIFDVDGAQSGLFATCFSDGTGLVNGNEKCHDYSHLSYIGGKKVSIPEPGTLFLLGTGLALIGLARRRKRT